MSEDHIDYIVIVTGISVQDQNPRPPQSRNIQVIKHKIIYIKSKTRQNFHHRTQTLKLKPVFLLRSVFPPALIEH